jgi:hypothetical protein
MVVKYFVSGDNLTSDNHHFHRIFDFYLGAGWFSDGVEGPIDYYNAWGFHYSLYWISEILSGRGCDVAAEALIEFVKYFKYFITLDGFPILGRSICYRTAVVAPLVAAGTAPWSDLDPGVSRRALWATWKHFIGRGALKRGVLTQGYWKKDLRLVDNYSGPASSLWGLRSLIIALAQPPCSTFWSAPMVPLPIEKGDFEFVIDPIGWRVTGDYADHDVTITVLANRGCESVRLSNYSLMRKISGCLANTPKRPPNIEAKYGLRRYSAKHPFFEQ